MDKFLILVMLWLGGFLVGLGTGMNMREDTGARCMSMYESPEDISECLWILNNAE